MFGRGGRAAGSGCAQQLQRPDEHRGGTVAPVAGLHQRSAAFRLQVICCVFSHVAGCNVGIRTSCRDVESCPSLSWSGWPPGSQHALTC